MNTLHLVDPELRPLLANSAPLELTPDAIITLRQQRQDAALKQVQSYRDQRLNIDEHLIAFPGHPSVRVCVITPVAAAGKRMGILHLHGGGHLFGSPEQSLSLTSATARRHNCVVVSVDYRLSPETVFPGSLEDSYQVLNWMVNEAAMLGIDPARIGVMGDSAGAGLAASLALFTRDRNGPTLAFQNLMFPMLDDRTVTETHPNPVTGEFVWTREYNRIGWSALLGEAPGGEAVSPYAAPARATDLRGLPPAWIGVGTLDLFLDENLDYAQRLIRAGVAVELHVWPGAFHGFHGSETAAVSLQARELRQIWLSRFAP
ncbi:alpha/beta hydrolase [Pantoea stewartii subsp. indologenes]|uniref:alpha/beta hydrolase n=1 Tax=Pantoea stewartii TaxID=66269 RepID=UPI001981FCA0|nr:alpha/beta hydrolase [Pantoea stewartii]MDK2632144.1 alpha/beta hydrolase [Pantoea stewartii subsp. indologenes]